jgi:hypothetical protein
MMIPMPNNENPPSTLITPLKHGRRFHIPSSLAPFFQEYDLSQLDLERSASSIIERVLQFGNREEILWLFSVYSRQGVGEWVGEWGGFALPEPHRTFWRLVLEEAQDAA